VISPSGGGNQRDAQLSVPRRRHRRLRSPSGSIPRNDCDGLNGKNFFFLFPLSPRKRNGGRFRLPRGGRHRSRSDRPRASADAILRDAAGGGTLALRRVPRNSMSKPGFAGGGHRTQARRGAFWSRNDFALARVLGEIDHSAAPRPTSRNRTFHRGHGRPAASCRPRDDILPRKKRGRLLAPSARLKSCHCRPAKQGCAIRESSVTRAFQIHSVKTSDLDA